MDDLFDSEPKLPNPKRKGSVSIGVGGWSRFHAAFSRAFVEAAIADLSQNYKSPLIFDPFVGSGTSIEAARSMGLPIVANDLDPVSALMSRAKASSDYSLRTILALLKKGRSKKINVNFSEADQYFSPESWAYCSDVVTRLRKKVGKCSNLVSTLVESTPGKYDNEVLALASILMSASVAWKGRGSSNPTWHKKTSANPTVESLADLTTDAATKIVSDLSQDFPEKCVRGTRVYMRNIAEPIALKTRPPNVVVTSPPYLTRIDYIKNHLPEVVILNAFQDFEIRSLRDQMIGTPTIPKGERSTGSGSKKAEKIMKEIEGHESFGSANYYLPFYRNYFVTMEKFLRSLKGMIAADASGYIVVQESRYKELIVDLPAIVVEQLESIGATASVRSEFPVGSSYSNLNSKYRNSNSRKLVESVVSFKF